MHMVYKVYEGFHHAGHDPHEGIERYRVDYWKGPGLTHGQLQKGICHRRTKKLHAMLAGVGPTP
jgi:hypothetical protein